MKQTYKTNEQNQMKTNLGQRGLVFHDVLISSHKNVELSTLQNRLCVTSHVW